VREISVVVAPPAADGKRNEPVEVRVLDRAGQVHVAVRSADSELNRSLGDRLGELTTQLEHSGYRAESWRPHQTTATLAASAAASEVSARTLLGGAHHEAPYDSSGQNQGRDGQSSGHEQRNQQQDGRPQWLEALEGSLDEPTSSIWSTQYDFGN
jgi:hypothetical protein